MELLRSEPMQNRQHPELSRDANPLDCEEILLVRELPSRLNADLEHQVGPPGRVLYAGRVLDCLEWLDRYHQRGVHYCLDRQDGSAFAEVFDYRKSIAHFCKSRWIETPHRQGVLK